MSAPVKEASLLNRVRELVISGSIAPGSQLSEGFLAESFDVSRTPVREVLKQLQNEGLVEIRPKVGTFVREPTRREIVELFQLKESLEGLGAGLMARRGRVHELELLEQNVKEAENLGDSGDSRRYVELVHEFHATIIAGSDNLKLVEHYERLMNQLSYQRIVLRTVGHPGRIAASSQEHRLVLEMILERDPYRAEWAMRNHVVASSREAMLDS